MKQHSTSRLLVLPVLASQLALAFAFARTFALVMTPCACVSTSVSFLAPPDPRASVSTASWQSRSICDGREAGLRNAALSQLSCRIGTLLGKTMAAIRAIALPKTVAQASPDPF